MVRRPWTAPGPWEVPIELFLGRVADLAEHCDRVIVVGTSFGSEAALLTGAYTDQVSAVVAFAPSDVVWAGVTADGRMTSHWALDGKVLPDVPFIEGWAPASDPPAFVEFYRRCRERFPDEIEQRPSRSNASVK